MNDPREIMIKFIQSTLPLPDAKAAAIVDFFTDHTFSRNDVIISDGTICNQYYFLAKGLVRSYTMDRDGNEVTTGFYSSGQIVCDLPSFFKRVPCRETYQALHDCVTLNISFDKLQVAFHSMPEFREFGRALLINLYTALKQRMLSTLHETAEERYANLIKNNPELFMHAPLKTIASYLGVTDSSLSRIRKEFAKKS